MLHCRNCGAHYPMGLSERLGTLRRAGKLRREERPDPQLVDALFEAEVAHMVCQRCGAQSLEQRDPQAEDELDPEEWGEARRCDTCRQPIHPDRLEVLPDTRQCSACAAAGRTAGPDEREFCPRCGDEMRLAASGAKGLARYANHCRSCGYRG